MKLGEKQTLTVVKKTSFGIYLAEHPNDRDRVLLPQRQVPEQVQIGDRLEVFLYKDSKDRLIATVKEPNLTLGGLAALEVLQVTKIGAFLDWGLDKDLLLPYKEQLARLREGDKILVTMYIDKSQRLCASQRNLYDLLKKDSPYKKDDVVSARVYEFSDNFGTFLAVDDCYSARIPASEDHSRLHIGQVVNARITGIKPDGKIDLTLREKSWKQMDADAESVMALIESYGGVLPFNDKVSPNIIMREAHMSKNAFKRAVGHLYKEHRIAFTEKGIRKV